MVGSGSGSGGGCDEQNDTVKSVNGQHIMIVLWTMEQQQWYLQIHVSLKWEKIVKIITNLCFKWKIIHNMSDEGA